MSFGLTLTITITAFHLIVRVLNVALYLKPSTSLCSDYEMLIANTRHCVSRCPLKCINDICFEDGVCPCENFYTTSSEKGLICSRECLPGCKEAGGYCAGPDLCLCPRKNTFFDKLRQKCRKFSFVKDKCLGRCLYGYCDKDGACTCLQGYKYQQKPLGQFCVPECKQDCGRLGYCFLPNMCACRKKSYHYGADGVCHRDEDYIY
uniref:Wnt inhibitory factor 1 n=1 Tax=Glossina morsitans morsitans TaxID=37546 RepID=A0ABK9MZ66_GLOMM